jgi:hypothetical protein
VIASRRAEFWVNKIKKKEPEGLFFYFCSWLARQQHHALIEALSSITCHIRLSYNPYFLACFLVRTVFFPRNKSANNIFSHDSSAKRTGSKSMRPPPARTERRRLCMSAHDS